MGGRDHIPGLALTHGRWRSRTWVLVRRACVAYVRETTSPTDRSARVFDKFGPNPFARTRTTNPLSVVISY